MVLYSVVGGILVARWLGPDGVGVYAVITLTANSLVQIVGAGLAAAIVYFVARNRELLPKVAVNGVVFASIGGTAAAVLVCIVAYLRPDWFDNVPLSLLALALVALPFQLWTLFGLNLFLTVGNVAKFNLLDSLAQSFVLLNALLILVVFGFGLESLVLLNTATSIFVSLLLAFLIWNRIRNQTGKNRLAPDQGLFRQMMRFGLKINVMNAALALVLRSDVLLVNYFRGQSEAGVYAVAGQWSLLLIMFPNVVGTMLFPNIALRKDDSGAFTARVTRHASVLQLLICAFAVPTAFILPFLYGASFSPATYQFLLLLPGAYFIGLQMILSQHLVGIGKISLLPFFWVFTLLLNVTLNLWFIPRFGGIAAAWVSSTAYLAIFLLTLMNFRKQTGQTIADLFFPKSEDFRNLRARLKV